MGSLVIVIVYSSDHMNVQCITDTKF